MPEYKPKPIWDDDAEFPTFEPLKRNMSVDVAIIGAGLTGITAALLLKEAGCRVALFDRRQVGGVDTGCTTAHLTGVVDTDLTDLVASLGRDHAQAVWDAGFAAIDELEAIVSRLGISCGFARVPGYRHVAFDATDAILARETDRLRAEARLARDLGFDVETVPSTPLVDRPGWRIEDQAVFHPRRYLKGLLEHLAGDGSVVCGQTEVSFTQDPELLSCAGYAVRAPYVFVATHNPLAGRQSAASAAFLQSQLTLFTMYALAAHVPNPLATDPAEYWDTSRPYRYMRTDLDKEGIRFIVGGEDHKTGQVTDTRKPFDALERWFRALVPTADITHVWSGQVIETVDGLPFIGEAADRQWLATGFGGNGMTFGTLAAMMVSDAITGATRNPWRDLFDVHRSAIARGPFDYIRENADYPYYMVRDRMIGPSTRHLRGIPKGEGRLVELDGRVLAASRDDHGRLTLLSSECTHLGCRVQWNEVERTWDCPCHGSRFTDTGEVLAGPAEKNLERVTREAAVAAS